MYFRLSDADRERYGGPDWFGLDLDALLDLPASKLADWEREIRPLTIVEIIDDYASAASLRAIAWVARKLAGVDHVPFEDFDPAVLRMRMMKTPPEEQGKEQPPPDSSEDSSDQAEA